MNLDDLVLEAADVLDALPDGDLDDEALVELMGRLDALQTMTRGARLRVDMAFAKVAGLGASVTVPGVGQAVAEVRAKRRTKGAALAARLVAHASDVPCDDDGVMLPPAAIAERTGNLFLLVFGLDNQSQNFRAGEVKKLGWKPGDFAEWVDGEPSVSFQAVS